MKYRKLRIAWSAVCGVVCLLLIAMWVRSYWRVDGITVQKSGEYFQIASFHGKIGYGRTANFKLLWDSDWHRTVQEAPFSDYIVQREAFYYFRFKPGGSMGNVPHWFAVLVCSIVAAVPWFGWRYSLRTLLAAMTLFAVGMGIVVYLTRI